MVQKFGSGKYRLRSEFLHSAVHDVNGSGRNDGCVGWVVEGGLTGGLHPTLRKREGWGTRALAAHLCVEGKGGRDDFSFVDKPGIRWSTFLLQTRVIFEDSNSSL